MNHDRHVSMSHIVRQNIIPLFQILIWTDIQPEAYTDYKYISFTKSHLQEQSLGPSSTDVQSSFGCAHALEIQVIFK